MLRRIDDIENTESVKTTIAEARFPAPFREGLEYSSPARGTWNIVHTGMLIPESHQIFVCALGCLRGVVLTAAEMNALDRYSSIQIREENVLDGGMEELMIEGVTDIIRKLRYQPKAILLFISCQHFFLAYDQELVFKVLRERFPEIRFTDCYMIPTLRKSGLTPDQKMRIQMYSMWERRPTEPKRINLIGSNLQTSPSSELIRMAEDAGYEFWDLYRCRNFEDYLEMAKAPLNLVYEPAALMAAEDLKKRLGQEYLYLSFSYDFGELEQNYGKLAEKLHIEKPDFTAEKEQAFRAITHAKNVIGETPIAIDYTFTFRILSFARLLLEYGFHVTEIYADNFLPEDRENFEWIRKKYPDIVISSTNRPAMRFLHDHQETGPVTDKIRRRPHEMTSVQGYEMFTAQKRKTDALHERITNTAQENCDLLAVGQKAAYFAETDHFVNVAESGGYYGFDGIAQVMGLMEDAFLHKKDRRTVIQRKGYGCESCL
ncbi:MAG: nitrogenase component 1 [Clostridiales bacterium]|nr:nitrogenase component 1 [Clostridiales bacterium]